MNKLFLKNKLILFTYLLVFLASAPVFPEISYNSTASSDVSFQNSDERNSNIRWVFKTINGKSYKRLYNTATKQWIGDWIPA